MTRKEITKLLTEILIADRLNDRKYFAKEVTIDYGTVNTKRIDVMEFVPQSVIHVSGIEKGEFICYEIKSCIEDIFSGNGLNFLGEKNFIVTTMTTYKKMCEKMLFVNNEIQNFIKGHNPESSTCFGVMVPVPSTIQDLRSKDEIYKEFENPTEFKGEAKKWRLVVMQPSIPVGRNRSTTELLFCMLRSKHSASNN